MDGDQREERGLRRVFGNRVETIEIGEIVDEAGMGTGGVGTALGKGVGTKRDEELSLNTADRLRGRASHRERERDREWGGWVGEVG